MRLKRLPILIVVAVMVFIAVFTMLELLGTAVPVAASVQEPEMSIEPARMAKPSPTREPIVVIVVYTDPVYYDGEILDLAGMILGDGLHFGKVKCIRDSCSKNTTVVLDDIEYEYKFSSRQALDVVSRRAVVEGTGTLTSGRQKERFTFTATFQDNSDGTIDTTYVASRPDASFSVRGNSGRFEISSK